MKDLILQIVGSWLRAILLTTSGVLVAHHVMTAPQSEQLSSMLFAQVINALPGLAAQVWSMLQKYWAKQKFLTALTMPVGTTESAVVAKMALNPAAIPSVTTPANTVPGVPKV